MNSFFNFNDFQGEAWIKAPLHTVGCVNWSEFSYKPDVKFKIIRVTDGFYLKFWVDEINCKGKVTIVNGPVYKDSCVEFFVSPADDGVYYNFEFNCIGNILLGCGKSRENRMLASTEVIEKILRQSSLGNKPIESTGNTKWELDVYLPYTAFFQHRIRSLSQLNCNFYKCGDETHQKHYLTWSPVKTERPDFHRPEYFVFLEI